ncbi:MAG: hypothetical protein ACKVQJ_14240 [Pyrinomonadaceae bacterium]
MSLTGATASEFPFSTKEPETYQGDFIATAGQTGDRTFVARKGDKWRFDIYNGADLSLTQIRNDKLYVVDHQKKVYAAMPENPDAVSHNVHDITAVLFNGKEYRDFDEIGRESGLIKYKVRATKYSKGDIFISIDLASGMIVREEFADSIGENEEQPADSFIFEIRNLKLEVDDSVFAIPAGYRKVTWDEYRAMRQKNK